MSGEELLTHLLTKLQESPVPLTLKEVAKGLPKAKKGQPKPEERAKELLEAERATARVFRQPSGKKGEDRYWAKDERHQIRERVLELAAKPMKLEALAKEGAKEWKAEAKYAEGLVRDLIGEGQLHEHQAKKGPSLFGATPPPPPPLPLSLPANAKKVAALVKGVQALMQAAGVGADEVLVAVRAALGIATVPNVEQTGDTEKPDNSEVDLAAEILRVVNQENVVDLAELRQRMPSRHRDQQFDQAVCQLADAENIILQCDTNLSSITVEQQANYVRYLNDIMTHAMAIRHDVTQRLS
jgi:hypothetical protein